MSNPYDPFLGRPGLTLPVTPVYVAPVMRGPAVPPATVGPIIHLEVAPPSLFIGISPAPTCGGFR